jgi:hypothetical protein
VELNTESKLEKVFKNGNIAVTSECDPSRSSDPSHIIEKGGSGFKVEDAFGEGQHRWHCSDRDDGGENLQAQDIAAHQAIGHEVHSF